MMVGSGKDGCGKEPGAVIPVVDRTKCEGKEDCVLVCPYDVFAVRELAKAERAMLPITTRLKAWAHRNRQAFVVQPARCHACGLCVSSCPEHAIQLSRRGSLPLGG
jgi:NAD-dependent dihydropyrimidine dehydrogenase PreA subunit